MLYKILKGQCHEIFNCWFFHQIASPGPSRGALEKLLNEKKQNSKISWHCLFHNRGHIFYKFCFYQFLVLCGIFTVLFDTERYTGLHINSKTGHITKCKCFPAKTVSQVTRKYGTYQSTLLTISNTSAVNNFLLHLPLTIQW